ncbi:MAG: aminotransferase class V-fold PLP-dependent enzyme [Solirubrobacterales bacterium]|nr:aminotransferase class V-fold PLP-dependent enzyme [Solirubrobacterales bacterium]
MRGEEQDRPETSALALPERQAVLEHAAGLIAGAWEEFDHAREYQPPVTGRHERLLREPLPAGPSDARAALDAAAEVLDVSLSQVRPRFFAYVASSGLEIGVLADALMASHDVNAAVTAGGADLLEGQVVRWVDAFVGFGGAADGVMAAGGQISNLTALAAARERALPGFRRSGADGRRAALYTSAEAHYSVQRSGEVLGLGADNVRRIALDDDRRMDVEACASAIDADLSTGVVPVAVVATAGTTLTGTVDDLAGLAEVCSARGVWLHVDGAYGLPAASTTAAGWRFAGLDRADSATVDAHKWLYVPKACSVLLMREAGRLEAAFSHQESYMPHPHDEIHPVDRTLEYSRPLRALKLWLAFRVHGADAIRAAIERNLAQAAMLAGLVEAEEGLELLLAPQLSAVCFRVIPPEDADPFAHNAQVVDAVNADGRLLIAGAVLDGVPCLRACVVNHRTTDADVRAIVEVVSEVVAELGDA